MRKIVLLFILFSPTLFAQQKEDERLYFSEALYTHLPKYEQKAKQAYRYRDYERAEELFDSLVNFSLSGSYMNNFKFRSLKKKEVSLYDFEKPVYLITYASWCIPGKGEIPALNKMAEKYHDKIDFIVLYWDDPKIVKKKAKEFSDHINVVYVDESKNSGGFVVKQLKHSLGLPTCFLLDKEKRIEDIRRNPSSAYASSKEESFNRNFRAIEEGISTHLIPDNDRMDLAENSIAE